MSVLKCKMCGGDIQPDAKQGYGTCQYCGGTMTLPRASDERLVNMFNRANHFRRQNEFDKALAAYESILNEDSTDAEAHWGVTLCRYGIEYVEDPASHKRVPTCHRVQYESILSDPDYLAALEHAPDEYTRSLYEQEAKAIGEIQKGILTISRQEAPFDVFICYKETTDSGSRTKDSVVAQDVYYQLTQAGYKVFFSRITLEDKLGSAYEPYIFAALNSARVMVVIGTCAEHFNSVWVRNEWSRYLALIKQDRGRLLIPCYQGMDAYDLPEQLSFLQSQDMGKIGFIQDLIRGVQKVLEGGKAKPESPSAHNASVTEDAAQFVPREEKLLTRAQFFLEDGDFENARQYFSRVLDMNPQCARAYMGQYMTGNELETEESIARSWAQSLNDSMCRNMVKPYLTVSVKDLDDTTQASVKSIYAEWKGDKNELDDWLNFEMGYFPLPAAVDAAKLAHATPDKNDSNYQKALRFATAEEKKTYTGYVEKMESEEIEQLKAFHARQYKERLPEYQKEYTEYLSGAIPVMRKIMKWNEMLKRKANEHTWLCIILGLIWVYTQFSRGFWSGVFWGLGGGFVLFIIMGLVDDSITKSNRKSIAAENVQTGTEICGALRKIAEYRNHNGLRQRLKDYENTLAAQLDWKKRLGA